MHIVTINILAFYFQLYLHIYISINTHLEEDKIISFLLHNIKAQKEQMLKIFINLKKIFL